MTRRSQGGGTQATQNGMVHVIAELSFAPESREEFLDAFRRLEPLVRAEAGCIEYRGATEVRTAIGAQSAPRHGVLIVIEKWAGEDALSAHLAAPHMAEFADATRGMMTGREIRIAQDISTASC